MCMLNDNFRALMLSLQVVLQDINIFAQTCSDYRVFITKTIHLVSIDRDVIKSDGHIDHLQLTSMKLLLMLLSLSMSNWYSLPTKICSFDSFYRYFK